MSLPLDRQNRLAAMAVLLVTASVPALAQNKGPIKIGVVLLYSGAGDNVTSEVMADAAFAAYNETSTATRSPAARSC